MRSHLIRWVLIGVAVLAVVAVVLPVVSVLQPDYYRRYPALGPRMDHWATSTHSRNSSVESQNEQGITVDRLVLFNHRIDLVKEQTARRKTELEKQQIQVAQKRQQLIKASTDRKIIEKLEEQQNAAYKQYIEKKEAGMLDEIAVLSHERKQR